jgi:AcrR family transcriptional regulator
MPKIIDYEARRREIAAKAASVLARDGILEANLGKVADSCGLGRTTLYQYFRNIGELVEFTLEETFTRLDGEAELLRKDRELNALDRLLRFMRFLEEVAIRDKDRMVLVLDFLLHPRREQKVVSFDVQERVRILRCELEAILAEAVASGELREMDTARWPSPSSPSSRPPPCTGPSTTTSPSRTRLATSGCSSMACGGGSGGPLS